MVKIEDVIQRMISDSRQIADVVSGKNGVLLFRYKTYVWLIEDQVTFCRLIFYPDHSDVFEVRESIRKGDKLNKIVYLPDNTVESLDLFKKLYKVVKETVYDLDSVLKDTASDS